MPTRVVGFGLESETVAVLLLDRVVAQEVDRLAEPLERLDRVPGRIALHALPAAPEHVNLRAQFRAKIHRPHRLLDRISADAGVVPGEGAVFEARIGKGIRSRHRTSQGRFLY